LSATLEVTTKKKKLVPILQPFRSQVVFKTKAGTNGNQTKINQDIAIIETGLPHGVKLYCVCDGHGLNGHVVSAFIKQNLISTQLYIKRKSDSSIEEEQ
jgi:serine/threonine protein phosphatase PrpC